MIVNIQKLIWRALTAYNLNVLEKNRVPQSIYKKWGFFPYVVEMRKNL